MYIRDLDIFADDSMARQTPVGFVGRFNREVICISDFYLSLIRKEKIATSDTAKISIRLLDSGHPNVPTLITCLKVCDVSWPYEVRPYLSTTSLVTKKRNILDTLYSALVWTARFKKWPLAPFEKTYREIESRKLKFEGFYTKFSCWSHDRRYHARLYFEMNLDGIRLYAVFRDRSGTDLGRALVVETFSWHGAVIDLVESCRWIGSDIVEVTAKAPAWGVPSAYKVDVSTLLK